MIEEKLKEVLNGLIPLCGTANIEPRIEDILSICKSEIAEACKKQREICAEVLRDSVIHNGYEPTIYGKILNAPSPLDEVK